MVVTATSIMRLSAIAIGSLIMAAFATASPAGWTADPALNVRLTTRAGDQVQPKIAPVPDGGFYVSWYDNHSGGYDVTLQRLDADGNPLWADEGRLVADRAFSWTMDYSLTADENGNALVAFRDDRGEREAVTVAKIAPDGTAVWGEGGVQVSGPAEFIGAPKVAAAPVGHAVVAWTEGLAVRLQRLDSAGRAQWNGGVTIADPEGAQYYVADLHAADDGSAVVSWVREREYAAPKHLYAQKLSADGEAQWGSTDPSVGTRRPVAVYDGGSLQFGNHPPFTPDGEGGAVFAWYSVQPWLTHVQWIRADGEAVFAHNGVLAAAENPGRKHVEPALAFNRATQAAFVFWRETVEGGGSFRQGVYGQKVTADAGREWGDDGLPIEEIDGRERVQLRASALGTGAVLTYVETIEHNRQHIWARRIDEDGDAAWPEGRVTLSTAESAKSKLAAARRRAGHLVAAWSDTRSGDQDIFVQNLNADGSLGPTPPTVRTEIFLPFAVREGTVRDSAR